MNHYFIGKLLNPEDANRLKGKQSYLSRQIPTTGKVFNFNTKFAYLGYMDEKTMLELQDKLNNVFETLTENITTQKCVYTKYDITGPKTTKKSISLLYQNPTIENVVVPYIRSFTDGITEMRDAEGYTPHVALVRFDARDIGEVMKKNVKDLTVLNKTFMPEPREFTVDSIDIMRGELKVRRSGPPSPDDDMDLKVVHKYRLR